MRTISAVVYSLALLFSAAADAGELTARLSDGVLYDGRVVCLFEDGTVATWEATSGHPDYELAAKLTNPTISRIASDGGTDKLFIQVVRTPWNDLIKVL